MPGLDLAVDLDRARDAVEHDEPVRTILHPVSRDYEDAGLEFWNLDFPFPSQTATVVRLARQDALCDSDTKRARRTTSAGVGSFPCQSSRETGHRSARGQEAWERYKSSGRLTTAGGGSRS